MKKQINILAFILVFLVLPSVSASHFIVGQVTDARDGTSPDDMKIVLWNPENGLRDRMVDVVGEEGNSGQEGMYMFDCHLLEDPCETGDELKLKILDRRYRTKVVSVIVGASGYDVADDLVLQKMRRRSRIRRMLGTRTR